VGKDNVRTALTLVGYEKDVQAAMEFVFGASFVCNDMAHAKKVTFDPKVRSRTVTLAGDTFDPSGTLTGGSRGNNSSVLRKLSELQEAEAALAEEQRKLDAVKKELATLRGSADKFRTLKEQYDLKVHEAHLLEERLKQGTHHTKLEEINELQASFKEQETMIIEAKTKHAEMQDRAKTLEEKIKNAAAVRERELKAAEQEVTKAKKKAEEASKDMKTKQQELNSLKYEVENLKQELSKYDDQLAASDQAIEALQQQLDELDKQAQESKNAVKEAKKELEKQKGKLREKNQDIQARTAEREALKEEDQKTQLVIKENEHRAAKIQRDSKDAAHRVEALMNKYEWIAAERQFFGQPNTAYDFASSDPRESGRRLQKLQETKEKLGKSVNMRAMNMLSKAEEKYNDLMKKKRIVENDKQKIMDTIKELDEKKNEALKKAWQQVNKDFGSIFSTLLPGTSAKLTPPEGMNILDGLEVKVAFGDVWKESLQELSGGQRSLVALSLILSLLLFKPAPLYILDEVDAALDLSHTQNIGQMLRTHFRHSQFIVVSLKDGMFNNANVLFKTKFVDGVSTVTRYTQQQSAAPASAPSAPFPRAKGTNTKKTSAKKARTEPLAEKAH
ncbi:structural maintenance of chromosomes protein 2-like, partial [Diadema antillarum]